MVCLPCAPAALAPVQGSPFPTGSDPVSVAFSPTGALLATANSYDNAVSLFALDEATRRLIRELGSPFATGHTTPRSMAFSPGGMLATTGLPGVTVFSVNEPAGVLTQVSGYPGYPSDPPSLAFQLDSAARRRKLRHRYRLGVLDQPNDVGAEPGCRAAPPGVTPESLACRSGGSKTQTTSTAPSPCSRSSRQPGLRPRSTIRRSPMTGAPSRWRSARAAGCSLRPTPAAVTCRSSRSIRARAP
jgi:hypothetical protein